MTHVYYNAYRWAKTGDHFIDVLYDANILQDPAIVSKFVVRNMREEPKEFPTNLRKQVHLCTGDVQQKKLYYIKKNYY